jgi:Tat protein translocase TatB subunit
MFEVGFSEIVLIAIIALLVVGPQEFPALVRNIGSWLGKLRQFMGSVKTEFDKEINRADEIKRLMSKEVEVAELHKNLDPHRRVKPPSPPTQGDNADENVTKSTGSVDSEDSTTPVSKQDHGSA